MANLTRKFWPKGWTPSIDRNGDPDGLLRMDNLHIDEEGVIGLVRGTNQIGGDFPDYVSDLFSETLNSVEYLYIGLANGRQVLRNTVDLSGGSAVIIDSGGTRPCFGSSLGQVYACSGTQRWKDRGPGSAILPLGLTTPTVAPTIGNASQSFKNLSTPWTLVEGKSLAGQQIYVDETSLRGVMDAELGGENTLTIDSTQASPHSEKDRFYILAQCENTSTMKKFRVEIYCDDDNYYAKEWLVNEDTFSLGQGIQSQLGCTRDEFIRYGSDASKNWASVSKIRVIGEATSATWFLANQARFTGGINGQLNGTYQYCSVNVNNNDVYEGKSGRSPISEPILIFNGTATVSPQGGDNQTTEQWIYRRSVASGEFRVNLDGTKSDDILPALLDKFYLVEIQGGPNAFAQISDEDALLTNIFLDESIISVHDITEPFIGITGLINERMLYLTRSFIYVSDTLNPDAIVSKHTIKAFGDPAEVNLWLKQIAPKTLVLGTTKDLYEITGDFNETPDGFLDITIHAVGEKHPPICADAALHSLEGIGSVFYIAADGWRVTTGQNSGLISPQLSKLFQKQDCYGVPPIAIYPGDVARYSLTVGRNKLFCVSQHTDGTRRLFVYDLLRKYWRLQYIDPIYVYATKTDRILLGFGETGSGFNLFELEYGDTGSVISDEGTHGTGFHLQTVLDHNQQPRNRKDTFTLKLVLDTGDKYVSVYIARNDVASDQAWVSLGNIKTSKEDTIFIKLDSDTVRLGFRYALKITNKDNDVVTFKLSEYTIEYEALPEQNTYMRIPNTNMGTLARKRWTTYAYIIDTLGNNVTFTPYIDNVAGVPEVISKATKLTYIYYFTTNTEGTDIGGTLSGGPFEFYQLNLEETISEKLPTPTKFLLIPANNYGSPNRKRHTSYKFQINTRGGTVRFQPRIDGFDIGLPLDFSTTEKLTIAYYFSANDSLLDNPDVVGVDIGGTLTALGSEPFEFYGVITPQQVEEYPPRLQELYMPVTDYGVPNRKRFTSHKFRINTGYQDVTYVPIIDGVAYPSSIVNTGGSRIHEHFFPTDVDVTGIDIGGKLYFDSIVGRSFFEYFGPVIPQNVEQLPSRLKSLYLPYENMGVAARKRIRTIPLIIDTRGSDVVYTPDVDGVLYPPLTINTSRKQTVPYYFVTDMFGIDIGGKLIGTSPFEYYGFGQFENVETLPVAKKYDQLQPFRFDKIGKLFELRVRMIATGVEELPYHIYSETDVIVPLYSTVLFSGIITTQANVDMIYTIQLPKSIQCIMFRFVLGPAANPFHRYDIQARVSTSGMESDSRWIPLR